MNKEKTVQTNEQLEVVTNKGIVGNTLHGCLTYKGIISNLEEYPTFNGNITGNVVVTAKLD